MFPYFLILFSVKSGTPKKRGKKVEEKKEGSSTPKSKERGRKRTRASKDSPSKTPGIH